MNMNETLSKIYKSLAETLNISDTKTNEVVDSYKAVGNYLGNTETELDIRVYPQGSLSLGTLIKPLSSDRNGDYDVDLVCSLEKGISLSPKEIKNIVGNRLKESTRYGEMLDNEGKRCWTLNYSGFHMDVLPCVPLEDFSEKTTQIRLTHKDENNSYTNKYSNPKGYREWFIREMEEVYSDFRRDYAFKNKVEVEDIQLFKLRTPLQMAIQILKRHRDIMFEEKENKPISIIITTLAAKSYNGEGDLFNAISRILNSMDKHIEISAGGEIEICNPTNSSENFADKWKEEPEKKDAFYSWLGKARKDIVEDPLNFVDGLDKLQEKMQTNFGNHTVRKTFEHYGNSMMKERENNQLGISQDGNLSSKSDKFISHVPNHTFYGGE